MKRDWIKLSTGALDDPEIRFIVKRYGWDVWGVFTALLVKSTEGLLTLDEEVFADFCFLETGRLQEILKVLAKYGQVDRNEDGMVYLCNWDKHQVPIEKLEEKREDERARKANWRAKKAEKSLEKPVSQPCPEDVPQMSQPCPIDVPSKETELEREEELEREFKTHTSLEIQDSRGESGSAGVCVEVGSLSPLFVSMRNAFQSKHPVWGDSRKEIAALQRLEVLLDQERARRYIEEFFKLTKSRDKFWSRQPFTPSRLLAHFDAIGAIAFGSDQVKTPMDTSWVEELAK